jgi:hypothetical protein
VNWICKHFPTFECCHGRGRRFEPPAFPRSSSLSTSRGACQRTDSRDRMSLLAVSIGLLYGPLLYRWWPLGHTAPAEEFAEALVDRVLQAFFGPRAV